MDKNLTNSSVIRQNVLNNKYAVQEIQHFVGIQGVMFVVQIFEETGGRLL